MQKPVDNGGMYRIQAMLGNFDSDDVSNDMVMVVRGVLDEAEQTKFLDWKDDTVMSNIGDPAFPNVPNFDVLYVFDREIAGQYVDIPCADGFTLLLFTNANMNKATNSALENWQFEVIQRPLASSAQAAAVVSDMQPAVQEAVEQLKDVTTDNVKARSENALAAAKGDTTFTGKSAVEKRSILKSIINLSAKTVGSTFEVAPSAIKEYLDTGSNSAFITSLEAMTTVKVVSGAATAAEAPTITTVDKEGVYAPLVAGEFLKLSIGGETCTLECRESDIIVREGTGDLENKVNETTDITSHLELAAGGITALITFGSATITASAGTTGSSSGDPYIATML